MLSRPQTKLLALLALSSFAQAGWFEDKLNEVIRRQEDAEVTPTASTPEVSPTISPPVETPTESVITPTETPTVTPTPSTSPSASPSPSSSATVSSTTPPSSSSTTPPSTSASTEQESSSTTPTPDAETTPPTTSASQSVVKVTMFTTIDGSVIASVSESTSTPEPTSKTANLAEGEGSESTGGGMSAKTKSTVIGVVVGIGGAILLGGLAIVAWRIWGRKKSAEEGDDLMDYSRPDTGAEKSGNGSSGGNNPFQSTLENYHNPAKQVNASSNF